MGQPMPPLVKYRIWFAYLIDAELGETTIAPDDQQHLVQERQRATMEAFGQMGVGPTDYRKREKIWEAAVKELRA